MSEIYISFSVIRNNRMVSYYDRIDESIADLVNDNIPYLIEWVIKNPTELIEYSEIRQKNDADADLREYYIGDATLRIYIRCVDSRKRELLLKSINNLLGEYREPIKLD